MTSLARLPAAVAAFVLLALAGGALAQPAPTRNWAEEKCNRYRQAYEDALKRQGRDGLSADFLAAHDRFISGGCTGPERVCPRSPREIDLANVMTVRAMNAGMASTFLPWACP
jgi:hypothetical protein